MICFVIKWAIELVFHEREGVSQPDLDMSRKCSALLVTYRRNYSL